MKQTLQICVLLVSAFGFSTKSGTQNKKAAMDEEAKVSNDNVKFGRKDLHHVGEIPVKDVTHKEDEKEGGTKNEEDSEWHKSEDGVQTQELDQGKSDEDSENQDRV